MKNYISRMSINSIQLIHLVRPHEVLYNHCAFNYNNKSLKNTIWEQICCQLFPDYESLMDDLKAVIRLNVQRRWKQLRDAIGREMKKAASIKNYVRKKESLLLSALEFLKPYIRTTYCSNTSNALEFAENWTSHNSTLEDNEEALNDQELDDLIDLTDVDELNTMLDEKNGSKGWDSDGNASEFSADDKLKIVPISAHPPSVMSTPVYCTLVSFTNGEFVTSNIMETETEEINEIRTASSYVTSTEPSKREQQSAPLHVGSVNVPTFNKRALRDDDNPSAARELAEQELEHAEDRMFMLSLVSALKRVPAVNKIQVKAEIIAVFARESQ